MRNLLLTIAILSFYSCHTKTTEKILTNSSANEIKIKSDKEIQATEEFCDTTKIADFTSNLTILAIELSEDEKEYQLRKANNFIKQSCEKDTLFCGEITCKKSTTYRYDKEWKLLLTGYVVDQQSAMEEESTSFFVLTIMKNNEAWFTDILEDLIGEIQVELNGFEDKDKQVKLWGHTYPYFQSDYGKFRLIIKNGMTEYEFQCHSQH